MKTKWVTGIVFLVSTFASAQTFQWVQQGGGTSGDYGNGIAVEAAGNSYVTGWFQNTATFGSYTLTSAGGYDMFIVKYDAAGQVQWAKRAGGTGTDIGYGIAIGHNNSIYLAGTFAGTADFGGITVVSNNNSPDIFLARYDANGNSVWVQQAGSSTDDQAQAIAIDSVSGHIYISGYFKSTVFFGPSSMNSLGQSDFFIAKYDTAFSPNNAPIWVHSGGGNGYDNSYAITTDKAGNAYLLTTADFGTDEVIGLTKWDPSGNSIWVRNFGGPDLDRGISITSFGSQLYFTGWFNGTGTFGPFNLISAGQDEIFIAAIDTSGTVSWAEKAGGLGYDQGYGICTDNAGNVFVTGAFDSLANFGATAISSNGSWDVFIAKYSSSGIFQWVMSGGGNANNTFERDIGYSIKADGMQNLYVTGIFRNTATFGTTVFTSAGIQDVFTAKISTVTAIEKNNSQQSFSIIYLPGSDRIIIKANEPGIFLFQLINIFGQVVYSDNLESENAFVLNTHDYANGVYIATLYSTTARFSKKMVLD